jgi:hypothetical protein
MTRFITLGARKLGEPEPEAEVAEEVGRALTAGAAVVVGEALVGGRRAGLGPRVVAERGAHRRARRRGERAAVAVSVRRRVWGGRVEGCAHRRSPWGCVWCAAAAAGRADPA